MSPFLVGTSISARLLAANTEDYPDLKRQVTQPGLIPPGFTTRDIVALVFIVFVGVFLFFISFPLRYFGFEVYDD